MTGHSVKTPLLPVLLAAALTAAWGCGQQNGGKLPALTPASHAFFPIASGEHALDCATCHTNPNTFMQYDCTSCHTHQQAPTDTVHSAVTGYAFQSASCLQCHPSPTPSAYSHTGITGNCASCHDTGGAFAALPVSGFAHMAMNGQDCGACHTTTTWSTGAMPSGIVFDPMRNVSVTGLVPSYAATSITAVTPDAQTLTMDMDHASSTVDASIGCAACHAGASTGGYYPGVFHASLAAAGKPQPGTCADCHSGAAPVGFVGPTAAHPARTPASGEMKHDAVEWSGGAPTATPIVTADCAVCHAPAASGAITWATGRAGSGTATFHASLTAATLAQPATCLDCHANTRPTGVLTSGTAALPAKVTFDHGAHAALAECATCHAASAGGGFAAWTGGKFHLAGSATPTSCLPCHAGERPTSAAGWASTTYTGSPFDYGTNGAGVTHGDGQDCALCHAGPGTGAWGGTQNWVGGQFGHGAATVAATTCVACHSSQRPDLQPGTTAAAMATLLGFDHSLNGTGDCFGCHQATVTAGRYVNYVSPTTHALPGGDWSGGEFYPGATPVAAADSIYTVTELTLTRTGALVTGFNSTTATLYGAMSHVSAAIPAAMSPGPAASPDMTSCWHCHTNTNGTVTSYAGGVFHAALSNYRATPGGAVTPFAQPTSHCADCHFQMRPTGIVEAGGSNLQPMDHAALFTSSVSIGGVTVSGAAGIDCSVCHAHPGNTWADGVFHSRIGSAVPQDCTVCHYPLMATAAADVASGANYAMSHRAAVITVQRCDVCHTTALSQATGTPYAATEWRTGAYHANVGTQPASCLACHGGSAPTGPTQSSVVYTLTLGGTGNNGAQWMSHAVTGVSGVDCATCHAADAKASGAAWSKSTPYHARVASPPSCQTCHGTANGGGTVAGTGNNLPAGLTNSTTVTSAASDASTGVPAGTLDQLVHTDVNVTGHDCKFCHTQVGPSTVSGVQGHEWAQAKLHVSFSATSPLVTNNTTGRCSNCHMNVKPGATFTAQDHSTFTATSGTQDCSACHSWPGTGTAASPNWLGGGNAPQYLTVGGFTVPNPPANPPVVEPGVANLPHPSTATTSCATCHTGGVGGKGAIGYDHASTVAATACASCHETGSNLVGTVWNGATSTSAGAGDTRAITITTRTADVAPVNHYYKDSTSAVVDCYNCHATPTGVAVTTTGTTFTSMWKFKHPSKATPRLPLCYMCHTDGNGSGT